MFIAVPYLAVACVYLFFAGGYAAITLMGWVKSANRYTDALAYVFMFVGALICGLGWPLTAIVSSFVRAVRNVVQTES